MYLLAVQAGRMLIRVLNTYENVICVNDFAMKVVFRT